MGTERLAKRTMMQLAYVALAILFAGCTTGEHRDAMQSTTRSHDEQTVRAFTQAYADAIAAEDAEAVLALMTHDFVALAPGKPPIVGLEATRRELTSDLAKMTIHHLQFEPREIVVKGDWAWTWGVSKASFTIGAPGETLHVCGKYLWILHRSPDESWRVARDSAQAD